MVTRKFIDLRSDTVTHPSKGMLDAILTASVGDDVFGEDPSVNQLEERTAKLFGKEAGVYCPSGTMTNQSAIKAHTQPGDELICDTHAHIYINEGGGIAFNSGVQVRVVSGDQGRLSANQVAENINASFDWLPRTTLVCLENTVNRAGGSYYSLKSIKEISEVCKKNNLKLHLDGARIFNALAETGDSAEETAKYFDSVSICFSKGLGCPVGSVLVGDKEFIKKARRVRKVFGGGMRQAGFLAAAANYALDNNIKRLKDDHHRAKKISEVLKNVSYVDALFPVTTNIIIFTLKDPMTSQEFIAKLSEKGVKGIAFGKKMVRIVTHLDFDDKQLEETLKALKALN
ncbi:MAG: aminotransferase class I/II-fold pyridoxal phosphate-dependent enzyme [Bacteroidetes bacterium]|nr:MAG: aminotransferase class I/II-fold pyridoxal phosphate-dependent enzyme [Bacteroidota bacterium]